MRKLIRVHGELQGPDTFESDPRRLTVIDPQPTYFYHQHGKRKISRALLLRVRWYGIDGDWYGWARVRDLVAAAVFIPAHAVPE